MKTKSINIFNLNVPCYNRCRYCLLSWDGKIIGIDYHRSVTYAKKLYEWLKINRPEIEFIYYFGYSMDHPYLFDAIKFMQYTNSPGGKFLQFDGMKKRTEEELKIFLGMLKKSGIETLDFTFYGTKEYHDKFAGRNGDYELMLRTIDEAIKQNLEVKVGIPVTKENLDQLDELVFFFEKIDVKLFLFTPHSGGRGINLLAHKITDIDYNDMSNVVKKYFNRNNNRTPAEWISFPPKEVENRVLTLSLTPHNIDELETLSFEDVISMLEEQDNKFYSLIPSFNELLVKYSDKNDNRLYSKKDLYAIYRARYIKEKNLKISDINDERYSGSIRY